MATETVISKPIPAVTITPPINVDIVKVLPPAPLGRPALGKEQYAGIPSSYGGGRSGGIGGGGNVSGGVKEKVIAAHRAGLKTIILPKENKKDLEDVPKEVKKDLNFVFVSHMDEVLQIALTKQLQPKSEAVTRSVLHATPPPAVD